MTDCSESTKISSLIPGFSPILKIPMIYIDFNFWDMTYMTCHFGHAGFIHYSVGFPTISKSDITWFPLNLKKYLPRKISANNRFFIALPMQKFVVLQLISLTTYMVPNHHNSSQVSFWNCTSIYSYYAVTLATFEQTLLCVLRDMLQVAV